MVESNSTQPPQIERPTPSILESLEDTGLDFGFLTDLTLKTVYSNTNCTTVGVAEKHRRRFTSGEDRGVL